MERDLRERECSAKVEGAVERKSHAGFSQSVPGGLWLFLGPGLGKLGNKVAPPLVPYHLDQRKVAEKHSMWFWGKVREAFPLPYRDFHHSTLVPSRVIATTPLLRDLS